MSSTTRLLLNIRATLTPGKRVLTGPPNVQRRFSSGLPLRTSKKPSTSRTRPPLEGHEKSLQRAERRQDQALGWAWLRVQHAEQDKTPSTSKKARKVARLKADLEFLAPKRRAFDAFRKFGTAPVPTHEEGIQPAFVRSTEMLLQSSRDVLAAKRKSVFPTVFAPFGEVTVMARVFRVLAMLADHLYWTIGIMSLPSLLWLSRLYDRLDKSAGSNPP